MDEDIYAKILINSSERKKEAELLGNRRYLYQTLVDAPKSYYIGVAGLRGIGKTTLLLQLAAQMENSIYISADAAYLSQTELYELVRFCSAKGHKNLFIDEIHYKKDWQQGLKTAYDEGLARIFFSGSSALEVAEGADLSRRALIFRMKPLSLREHLCIKRGFEAHAPVLAQGLFDKKERGKAMLATSEANDFLYDYFHYGGVAYGETKEPYFSKAIENTLEKIIHSDLAYLRSMDVRIENEVHRILQWIAISPPGETNYSSLASKISLSKPTLIRIIDDLVKIGLVIRILPCGKDLVRKEPKLYLAFPFRDFLARSVEKKPDVGALREEFFVNHAQSICYIKGKRGEKTADFQFEGKKVEIGGSSKNWKQNPDFIFKEGIAFGDGEIPLYLAGFLY